MNSELATLSQDELLALALESSAHSDEGRSIAYLKEACGRADATHGAHFLLGSQYAQIGLMDKAGQHFERAVAINPAFAIARFQLGLLQLTNARPQDALETWAPLNQLAEADPLRLFHLGMQHLIRDEFTDCQRFLQQGMDLNAGNPALNANMQLILNRIQASRDNAASGASTPPEKAEEVEPQGHVLLNAYAASKLH